MQGSLQEERLESQFSATLLMQIEEILGDFKLYRVPSYQDVRLYQYESRLGKGELKLSRYEALQSLLEKFYPNLLKEFLGM